MKWTSLVPVVTPRLRTYFVIGLAVALALSLVTVYTEFQVVEKFKAQRNAEASMAKTCQDAALSQETTIARLRAANDGLVQMGADQIARMQQGVVELEKWKQYAATQAERLRHLEAIDRGKPNCQMVLNTRIDDVCPGIAAGVLERSERRLQRPTG